METEAEGQWICPRPCEQAITDLGYAQQSHLQVCVKEGYEINTGVINITSFWLFQDLVTFEDVSLRFSEEEWALLDQGEKALYWNVMHQNYDNVAWLSKNPSCFLENPAMGSKALKNRVHSIRSGFCANRTRDTVPIFQGLSSPFKKQAD